MAFNEITTSDTAGKGVVGLPDTPGLSASEMQRRFDEIALEVIIPKYNQLIADIKSTDASKSIGALNGAAQSSTVQNTMDEINTNIYNMKVDFNELDKTVADNYQTLADLFKFTSTLNDTLLSSGGAAYVGCNNVKGATNIQGALDALSNETDGSMKKTVYDTDNKGYVDKAAVADNITGIVRTDIQMKTDNTLTTTDKTVVGAINELKADESNFQPKLTAGSNITIDANNVISATGGGGGGAEIDYGTAADFELVKDSLPEGASYYITDDYVEGGGIRFSLDEIPIGTWIDGRTIFRKVFDVGGLEIKRDGWTASNISQSSNNINEIIGALGWGLTGARITFRFDLMASLTANAGVVSFLSDRTNANVTAHYISVDYLH